MNMVDVTTMQNATGKYSTHHGIVDYVFDSSSIVVYSDLVHVRSIKPKLNPNLYTWKITENRQQ